MIELTHEQLRSRRPREVRGVVIPASRLKRDRNADRDRISQEELNRAADRPRTRNECIGGPRPCPFVGCKHNLYLDVSDNGNIKLQFPDLEPEQMPATGSCVLDIADLGGVTLERVGEFANVTRERVRQLENLAYNSIRRSKRAKEIADLIPDSPKGESTLAGLQSDVGGSGAGEGDPNEDDFEIDRWSNECLTLLLAGVPWREAWHQANADVDDLGPELPPLERPLGLPQPFEPLPPPSRAKLRASRERTLAPAPA